MGWGLPVETKRKRCGPPELKLLESRMMSVFGKQEHEHGLRNAQRRMRDAQVEQSVIGSRIGAYPETASVRRADLHREHQHRAAEGLAPIDDRGKSMLFQLVEQHIDAARQEQLRARLARALPPLDRIERYGRIEAERKGFNEELAVA